VSNSVQHYEITFFIALCHHFDAVTALILTHLLINCR